MIIERIRKINNIGTYEKAGDGRIRLQPLTYIYALNTYGKTTFCDILRSFKNNDVSIINNRRRIGCSPSERCEVELTINGENVTFDGQCWNVPAAVDIREQLQIFDINFVNENIFTNFNIEHRNKENFTSFVLGTRGVELIQLLDAMETDLASKEQDAKAKKTTLEKMLGGVTFDELKKIKYQESFKEVECLIISAKEGIKELKKQKTEIDKIKGLKGIDLLNMNFDKLVLLIETIQEELKKKYSFDLTAAKNEIETIKKENSKISDEWMKNSASIINGEETCPLCGSKIIENERIKVIAAYFSEEIISIIDTLEKLSGSVEKDIRETVFASLIAKAISNIPLILSYCGLDQETREGLSRKLQQVNEKIELFNKKIPLVKEELVSHLKKKLSSISETEFSFNETDELLSLILEITSLQEELNIEIQKYNITFSAYQANLSESFLDEKIAELVQKSQEHEMILLRGTYNEGIEEILQLNDYISSLKKKIKETRVKIDVQQEEFLNKYFETIQEIFAKLGSENYRIEREATPRGKKKVYGVKIFFKDKLIDQTRYCLSESDRRALALSVFLAKIKVDNNPNEIIVLDDPITSFDENRMRLFIGVLEQLKNQAFCQAILLLHYEHFFNVLTKVTPEKTLLKIVRIRENHIFQEITEEDDLFKTEYEKKLGAIIRFINAIDNDIAENDVRIYFETFLSYYYAYNISKEPSLKGPRLHDFICNLRTAGLINEEKKIELLSKLRFLNNSSHSFTSYTEEEKRSFVKDAYVAVHQL